MATLAHINNLVKLSLEIIDGLTVYYPSIDKYAVIDVLDLVTGRDRCYSVRNGVTAYVIGCQLYVTPEPSASVALEAIGFRRDFFFVPLTLRSIPRNTALAIEWRRLCLLAEAKKK